jgi:tetratricopeptide (TPR) repeat protein
LPDDRLIEASLDIGEASRFRGHATQATVRIRTAAGAGLEARLLARIYSSTGCRIGGRMACGRWLRSTLTATVVLVGTLPAMGEPQSVDDPAALRRQVSGLHGQGKYDEAVPLARRYVVVARQKHGEEHAEFATAIACLANVYRALDRMAEAEPLYQRALAIREKALAADHPLVAASLNSLAELYRAQGRHVEAEPLYKRSLAVDEKMLGPDHPAVAQAVYNLARLYREQGRTAEAEQLMKRALAIRDKVR